MSHRHRFTTSQLAGILFVSALVGAGAAILLGRGPAGAAAAAPAGEQAKGPAEKKAGRPVVHFEIGCRDSAKSREFYSKLFDWQIRAEGPASVIETGAGRGINGHITSLGHEPEHFVTFYVEVDDVRAYLDRAGALGGKTLVPPVKIATGQFAWLADPDGNIVGLLQPKKP